MRSGARNIRISFTGSAFTHFGGVYLVHEFLRNLRFCSFLHEYVRFSQRNNDFTLSELLVALLYPMILGLERIEVSALLNTNGVFQYITGLRRFPDPQTLRRFLIRAAPNVLPQLRDAHDRLRTHFLSLPATPASFWIDCDSTVRTLYGKQQEGVVKGYNPNHPGKKSYHPLIITEGHRGDCLAGILRFGNAHTADGVETLLTRVRALLPHHERLRLRADCGFYSGSFIADVRQDMDFAVIAKTTKPIKERIAGLPYQSAPHGFATAAFTYRPHGWDREEQFIALRREILPDTEDEQQTLFTLEQYAYSVIVSNLPLLPYQTFSFYGDRMGMERMIRILKEDYLFGTAQTGDFDANALYAEISILAYNLIIWFKRLCLPEDWQSCTLPTIRRRLLMIPGEFVRTHNIPTLRFAESNPYKDVFFSAQKKIRKLEPLIEK
ncbi:IS1380 family transposase [Candidatus Peregrinibacteria bacterium]|nr:IS1380 family transposase [Candidatus Peregrinibacteria bacterium]